MVIYDNMKVARSRITAQGQVSVPAEVRRRLGVRPGSEIEWSEENDTVVVRRVGKYSWEDIHKALFPHGPPKRVSVEDMDEGIRSYIRKKHARR
jgi:antitoxin PrlF